MLKPLVALLLIIPSSFHQIFFAFLEPCITYFRLAGNDPEDPAAASGAQLLLPLGLQARAAVLRRAGRAEAALHGVRRLVGGGADAGHDRLAVLQRWLGSADENHPRLGQRALHLHFQVFGAALVLRVSPGPPVCVHKQEWMVLEVDWLDTKGGIVP